ncbi:hypothetical protein HZH66_014153 [Vespula vulgaris]|uniref:Uncharacterized protein n=1 Tax=Vespula vulgaris TaxID=7454 RepID=A0A834MPT4_VESVU|nr:hypothetical protein HZH66_014153 [Vespula vulgaris]
MGCGVWDVKCGGRACAFSWKTPVKMKSIFQFSSVYDASLSRRNPQCSCPGTGPTTGTRPGPDPTPDPGPALLVVF